MANAKYARANYWWEPVWYSLVLSLQVRGSCLSRLFDGLRRGGDRGHLHDRNVQVMICVRYDHSFTLLCRYIYRSASFSICDQLFSIINTKYSTFCHLAQTHCCFSGAVKVFFAWLLAFRHELCAGQMHCPHAAWINSPAQWCCQPSWDQHSPEGDLAGFLMFPSELLLSFTA